MNILSKLFSEKSKKENETAIVSEPIIPVIEPQQNNVPPLDLFIDNETPQPTKMENIASPNKITSFLNRNYHSMGLNDGFEYHSQETLEIGKKKLKAEFQLIIDQSIQEKSLKRLELKNLTVHVAQIADTTRQTLENTIEEVNLSLGILLKQKDLCAENEGWVMNVIHSYHQGFIQGLNDFISGENFLSSINNI